MTLDTKLKSLVQLAEEYHKFANSVNWDLHPKGLYEPIQYIMGLQGKSLRPQALLMFANFFSHQDETALKAAYALELFHNFTLVHDDLVDQSETRRGKPTIHLKFGVHAAVLSGDSMMIYSIKMLNECFSELNKPDLMPIFYNMAIEVCEGQDLDMSFESKQIVLLEDYLKMIRQKTSVLLATCFKLGAAIGGLDRKERQKAYQLGECLGLAFQIQDDWLDFYGDPSITGKQRAGDVLRCKKTILLIKALDVASETVKETLLKHYQQNEPNKIEVIDQIFNQLQIRQIVYELFMSYRNECNQIIESFTSLHEIHKNQIRDFINQVLNRNS